MCKLILFWLVFWWYIICNKSDIAACYCTSTTDRCSFNTMYSNFSCMILYSFSFQFCSFVSVQICCKIKMHKKSFKKNNKRLSKNILASAWAFQELHKSLFLRHILNPFFINFSVKWMVMNKNKNLKKMFNLSRLMLVVVEL